MRVTTLETIAGRSIDDMLGYVRGTAIWSRRILKNKTVGMRAMEHMTLDDVSNGLAKAREDAEAAMFNIAKSKGADSVIAVRVDLIELGNDTFQAVATGTAVTTSALATAMPAFEEFELAKTFSSPANDAAVILPFQPRKSVVGAGRYH